MDHSADAVHYLLMHKGDKNVVEPSPILVSCPICNIDWYVNKHNACQCGATYKSDK